MTRQEYYDLLVKSAVEGTFPGWDGRHCTYRTADGKHRCAIGILIPDEMYDSRDEGASVNGLDNELIEKILPEDMIVPELLLVQELHDEHAFQWDTSKFIKDLNELRMFKSCKKVSPEDAVSHHAAG